MTKWKTLCGVVLGLLVAGCAVTSSAPTGPNGRPVHYIDGTSAAAAFDKAAELCPGGYQLLGDPRPNTSMGYGMTIECK